MKVTLRAAATPTAAGLVLRPWGDGDAEALVEAFRDPLMRQWSVRHIDAVEDAEQWLEEQRLGWEGGERLSFAVYEASREASYAGGGAGRPAGNVVLKRTGDRPGAAEVGYWTAAPVRGRGVASRALEAVTAWAFETFGADGLERLELLHQVDNLASCRVAEKAGYGFARLLPPFPPFPSDGHLHVRQAPAPAGAA